MMLMFKIKLLKHVLRSKGYSIEIDYQNESVIVTYNDADFVRVDFKSIDKHNMEYIIKYVRWMLS